MDDDLPDATPYGTVYEQALTLIEDGADEFHLVRNLDFSSLSIYDDQYADWHTSYPLEAMVRAHLLRDLMGYTMTELHSHLRENPDEAVALGFESIPARTTLGRAYRDRFDEELVWFIEYTSEQVLEYAHEHGNPLGMRALSPEEKTEASRRTEQRFIGEKTPEVINELRRLVFSELDLQRPDKGTQYDTATLLGVQSLMGLTQTAANQGSDMYRDRADDQDDTPTGETLLHYLKQLDTDDIVGLVDAAIGPMLAAARRHLEFDRPVTLAIDLTYIAFYGEQDEAANTGPENERVVVQGAPPSKEYKWCYKFATASIVGDNTKFTLAMRPVVKGERLGKLVRELYWAAREHVTISEVYADAEFYAADVIEAFREAGVSYIIHAPHDERIARFIDRMDHDVAVKHAHAIYGPVAGGPTNSRTETTLAAVPKADTPSETVVFATNMDVDDEIGVDRRSTKRLINRYRRRWDIEIGYRSIKDFLAYTTSKEYSVRLFHFGFAVILYNMWLLVDFLLKVSFDELAYRIKPRLPAKRFMELVKGVLTGIG
ncbi:hypothetical protein BRD04_04375 [Halobacteriales archaeon QS_9_67_17]|nr:MAG: hypothetical protein BRD04_04375 [Halobacteriales archaeon QS_9_67_17]